MTTQPPNSQYSPSQAAPFAQLQLQHVMVVGANGAIGTAWVEHLLRTGTQKIITVSRHPEDKSTYAVDPNRLQHWQIDFNNEAQIADYYGGIEHPLDAILVCTGILHDETLKPEKSLRQLNHQTFMEVINTNTWIPMLIAKYGLTKLRSDPPSLFAVLSARVGSIEDNRLGGWYSYRASKAALNMLIKCAAIEQKRRNDRCVVVGLHPGTVDSRLSQPFQKNVPSHKLFSPQQSVEHLSKVIENLNNADSGHVFAWDGEKIDA